MRPFFIIAIHSHFPRVWGTLSEKIAACHKPYTKICFSVYRAATASSAESNVLDAAETHWWSGT